MHVANTIVRLEAWTWTWSNKVSDDESSHLRHHLRSLGPKGDNLVHLIGMGVALFLIILIAFVIP